MANIKHVDSVVDRDFRNRINQLIDVVNSIGTSLNDLVVKGVMTTEQYSDLLTAINGLVKIGEINKDTLSIELKNEIEKINNKVDKGNVSVADINKNLGKLDQTFLSDELLQQIAGTANINATVADNSVTTQKLTDKSVTGRKTDFIKVSSNLLNPKTVLSNKSIDLSGNIIDDPGYFLSELIPFGPSKTISFTHGTYRIALYDKDKKFLVRTGVTSDNAYSIDSDKSKYFRISRRISPENVMLNYGSQLEQYEPYYESLKPELLSDISFENIKDVVITPENTVHFKKSNNIFNKFNVLLNRSFDSSGNIVEDKDWVVSPKIKIEGDTVAMTTAYSVRWALYDENDNFVARSGKNANDSKLLQINSPSIKYLRLSVHRSVYDTFMANYGDKVLPYDEFGYTLVSTDELPIHISSDIIARSNENNDSNDTSSNTDGYVVNLENTKQLNETYDDSYKVGSLTELYSTDKKTSLDYIELTSNRANAELVLSYNNDNGETNNEYVINPENKERLPLTIENIVNYGYPNVEFLVYDPRRSQFKIAIKNLNFSNGFTLSFKNGHTIPLEATTRLVGRYYV